MLPKSDTVINNVLNFSYLDEYKILKPCYKIEIFEGSIYEWQALNNNITWKTLYCSSLVINRNAGQASTLSATFSTREFYKHDDDIINYNFDDGSYTHISGVKISKGFIIRGYIGYFKDINDKRYILKFTGIIDNITIDDNENFNIMASDFTVLFLNSLNYNYPNIKSYQDIPFEPTNLFLLDNINSSVDTFNVSFDVNNILKIGQRIQIDSEIMIIINKFNNVNTNKTELKVKRVLNIGDHNTGVRLNIYDDLIVVPDEIFTDNLSNRYVPAYDNWRLDYAIRDLCIKAKFPLSLLVLDYNDKDKIRLMAGEKYPYMQSKSVYERVTDMSLFSTNNINNYDAKEVYVEKKYYIGIDENMLNEARFKLDFGINLWDAINRLLEPFSIKAYFNEAGELVIKGFRQYKYLKPLETVGFIKAIENHVLSWVAWDLNSLSDKLVTFNMPDNVRVVKTRFITTANNSSSVIIEFLRKTGGSWTVLNSVTIPALSSNSAVEVPVYEAFDAYADVLPVGFYAIRLVSNVSNPPLLNGLVYLDTPDESVCWRYDSLVDTYVNNITNSADNVRNKITIIGLPESPQPIVTQAIDYTSIFGGSNVISMLAYNNQPISSTFVNLNNNSYFTVDANTPLVIYANKIINIINLAIRNIDVNDTLNIKIYTTNVDNPLVNVNINHKDLTTQGIWLYIPSYNVNQNLKIIFNKTINLRYIYGINIDRSFNFIGSLRETIVVKKNIADKASANVLVYNQIDIHRRNVTNIVANIIPNPYLQSFDCITVNANFMGVYNSIKTWVTGYTISMSYNDCKQSLTLQNIPPVESYTLKPQVNFDLVGGDINQIYDFSITRKKSDTHEEIETVYSLDYELKLSQDITNNTNFNMYSPYNGYNLTDKIIRIDSEFMKVTNFAVFNSGGIYVYNVNVIRGFYDSVISHHTKDTIVFVSNILNNFDPPSEYLTFNFAIPDQRRVQLRVGIMFRNQTLAYVMEEKILAAGVYKRENGIRWDGGIDFAKVWTDSVNKIYLPPNNRYNYMYNRMFHPGADSRWEDPKYNFYFWAFNNDVRLNYPIVGSASASTAGWVKTPSLYDAMIITRPVLASFYGSIATTPTATKFIWLTTKYHENKLILKDPIPLNTNKNSYVPVSVPVAVLKDGVYSEVNDVVYFDAYVSTADGGNVNLINAPNANPETPRRWVIPIGLNQIIQWDFTDSQGKLVKTAPFPGIGYKITILNAFDVYGEGVEIVKQGSYNIINGDFKITDVYNWQNKLTALGWSIIVNNFGDVIESKDTVYAPFKSVLDNYGYYNAVKPIVAVKGDYLSVGGHTNNDAYFRLVLIKNVKTIGWDNTKSNPPASLYYTLDPMFKPDGPMYFRFFYKPSYRTGSLMLPQNITLTDVWRPVLVIKYLDTDNNNKVKYLNLNINGNFDVWNESSLLLTTSILSDVMFIKSIGIDFRILDNETPQNLHNLKSYTQNVYLWIYLGVDSFELGKGSVIPNNYQPYQNDYRTTRIFYFYE